MKRPSQRLMDVLGKKKLTLALAESVTCGLAAHQLSTVKGTSEILKGSMVCYREEVKTSLLGVPEILLKQYTAESQEVTDEMALQLEGLIPADIHAAVTGLSSKGGSETPSKPVGTAFISVLYRNKLHRSKKRFRGSPLEIRKKICDELYNCIAGLVGKNGN